MEDVVDVLKMVFGLLVFLIAITLTFFMVGKARQTADVVFEMNDRQKQYQYVEENDYNVKEDRIVSFETIIPTIYRYAKEQYAVTIFNRNGEPIVRYDTYVEGFMQNWDETLKKKGLGDVEAINTYKEVKNRLEQVQNVVNRQLNKNVDIMSFLDNRASNQLYSGKKEGHSEIKHVAPWIGDTDQDILTRIQTDIKGESYTKNQITYYGKNLWGYKSNTFLEKFLEIETSGETVTDGEDSIETIKGNKKLEIIYILQ